MSGAHPEPAGPKPRETLEIILRPATPADAGEIANIYLASRKTFLPFAPLAHTDEEVRQWIANILIPTGGVTLATAGSRPVGMIAISRDNQYGWIRHFYLHPSITGKGIGALLLARAIEELAGAPIRLYTFQANTGARRFYERHGFQPIAFSDGSSNAERCPDVLYERRATSSESP